MDAHRLRAPSLDGALLAEPSPGEALGRLAENAERLALWDGDIQGRPASRLRTLVRRQVLDRARAYHEASGLDAPEALRPGHPVERGLVVTGHQPELFHPGVWVKNFAAAEVARLAGGVALNLVIDNDLPKSSVVKVPGRDDRGPRVGRVAFDEWAGEVPYEDLDVQDEPLYATFARRAREDLAPEVRGPVLDEFWPIALAARGRTRRLGLRFAIARRGVEASWGVRNVEVPLSAACETEGFHWFASHLLAQLPRFQQIHNRSLDRYRALYHIRSRHHPVPALGREGDWLESPFWAWRAGGTRRRPLLARQRSDVLDLRIGGESEPFAELPLGPDREACCAVERLGELPALGVRLRTRALTTTMFARYFLGDLFLHGIGGAKYDELGDEISARFYGVEPPAFMTVSLTLWPGLEHDASAPARLAAAARELRDLTYNPDRHLNGRADAGLSAWAESKRRAILGPVDTHAQRLERFHEIRRCNAALRQGLADRERAVAEDRARLAEDVRRGAAARSREYPFVFYPRRRVREAFRATLPGLRLAGG